MMLNFMTSFDCKQTVINGKVSELQQFTSLSSDVKCIAIEKHVSNTNVTF